MITGRFAGQVREIPPTTDPMELFGFCARENWAWEVEWASATSTQEKFVWGRADMVGRCLRALLHGRPVFLSGKRYAAKGTDAAGVVAGQLEDAIVNSGTNVRVGSDDEDGVVIELCSDEEPGSSARN